jgi:photosystem II stability/assembly factor-like uncharacterized protein
MWMIGGSNSSSAGVFAYGTGGARLAASPAGNDQRHRGRQKSPATDRHLGAIDLALTTEELAALDQVSRLPSSYPGWIQEVGRQPLPAQ